MQQAKSGASGPTRPALGSLFVPTRATPATRPHRGDVTPSSVCRVASLEQQRHPLDPRNLARLILPSAPTATAVTAAAPALALPPTAPSQQRPHKQAKSQTVLQEQQRETVAALETTARGLSAVKPALFLSWAGSGIFFWWQLGAVQYLAERYDLSKVPMAGASGGGLAAVIATCGVDAVRVMDSAYELSLEHNIWERPSGLTGIWGGLIEAWLHELLPEDAAERCRGQVDIVITQLPSFRQVAVSDFADNADLVDAAMASAHVPIFLDWRVTRDFRGVPCMDGSVPDFFTGNCELLTRNGRSVVFDYFEDPRLVRKGRMDMLQLKGYPELRRIMRLGYRYAHRLHADGAFRQFDTSGVAYERVRRRAPVTVRARGSGGGALVLPGPRGPAGGAATGGGALPA